PGGMTIDNLDVSRSIPDFDVEIQELENNGQRYRVSLYSSARHKLPVGRSELTLDLGWGDNTAEIEGNNSPSKIGGVPEREGGMNKLLQINFSNILFSTSLGEDERSQGRTATLFINPDDPTGIANANGQSSIVNGQSIYDLQGRNISDFNSSTLQPFNSLPKGVYIINQQKIIVR
ncbi:MAG: T9SS type A sorting domain-containing protein, partial [Bacteroidaceae bacterium]|nr:T9SS type A sorting domain-containing protein [Bacteroidaceae bacterium]